MHCFWDTNRSCRIFWLGRHELTNATLQSVVECCTTYDKHTWSSVGYDGQEPACSPSANAACLSSNSGSCYNAMASMPFSHHLTCWRCCLFDAGAKCIICHNPAQEAGPVTKKCPILKKLGLKLKKHLAADNSNDLAVQVMLEGPTPLPVPAPSPAPAPDSGGGSASIPGACTASTEAETYNSGDKFDYRGKYEGVLFDPSLNKKNSTSVHSTATHLCSQATMEIQPSANSICPNPIRLKTVSLPKHIMRCLTTLQLTPSPPLPTSIILEQASLLPIQEP